MKIKKAFTSYYVHLKSRPDTVHVQINEETPDHISVYDGFEPCSGVLKHYGTREELIKELEEIIEIIKKV